MSFAAVTVNMGDLMFQEAIAEVQQVVGRVEPFARPDNPTQRSYEAVGKNLRSLILRCKCRVSRRALPDLQFVFRSRQKFRPLRVSHVAS